MNSMPSILADPIPQERKEETTMERILLLGGPGNISRSSITELLARKGCEVAVFTLSDSDTLGFENQVKFYRGNRDDADRLEEVIRDFRPDVVVDYVCFHPAQAEAAAELLGGRVRQYVFLSTVDVYGYPLSRIPMREYDEKRPANCEYAVHKYQCEQVLQRYADRQLLPLTIVRPVYSFGPGFLMDLVQKAGGREMIPRIREGRPILVPGGGNTLIHVSSAHNTGRMIAWIAGHYASVGKIYNCGHPQPMTHDEYVRLFARVLGKEEKLVHVPFETLLALDCPQLREILPILTQFNLCFSVDAFREEFPAFEWDYSLEDAAREYIEYNDKNGRFADGCEESFEDRIIEKWLSCTASFRN